MGISPELTLCNGVFLSISPGWVGLIFTSTGMCCILGRTSIIGRPGWWLWPKIYKGVGVLWNCRLARLHAGCRGSSSACRQQKLTLFTWCAQLTHYFPDIISVSFVIVMAFWLTGKMKAIPVGTVPLFYFISPLSALA